MSDIKILTVPFDPSIGMFNDEALAGYLKDREVLRVEPQFFTHETRPYWTVFVETRLRQGHNIISGGG